MQKNINKLLQRNWIDQTFFGHMNATLLISRRIGQSVTVEQAIIDFMDLYDITEEEVKVGTLKAKYYVMLHEMKTAA